VARGSIAANGRQLAAGDALVLAGEKALALEGGDGAEVLVFDLAP
jgi:quercetin 2,3-dioxygenase